MKKTQETQPDNDEQDESEYLILSQTNPEKTSRESTSEFHSTTSTQKTSRQFLILIFLLLLGLIASIITYRGPFQIWKYPLSDLGTLHTVNNKPNIWSRYIFDLTMIVSGFLMIRICTAFSNNPGLRHYRLKSVLTFICAIGFFILIFPYDISDAVHEAGATLVFGSFWILIVEFTLELKHLFSVSVFWMAQLVLQGTVLPYAALFAIGSPIRDVVQKIAVAGLMFSLWMTTKQPSHAQAGKRGYEAKYHF